MESFINVAGIDSPGLTSSPAVAKMVVDLVLGCLAKTYNQKVPVNTTFNPLRKAIIQKKDASFQGSIDDKDPKKNIICRCERVTEAEIVDSN